MGFLGRLINKIAGAGSDGSKTENNTIPENEPEFNPVFRRDVRPRRLRHDIRRNPRDIHLGKLVSIPEPEPIYGEGRARLPESVKERTNVYKNLLKEYSEKTPEQFYKDQYESALRRSEGEYKNVDVDGEPYTLVKHYGNPPYHNITTVAAYSERTRVPISHGFHSIQEAEEEIEHDPRTRNYLRTMVNIRTPTAEVAQYKEDLIRTLPQLEKFGETAPRGSPPKRGEVVVDLGGGDLPDTRANQVVDIGTETTKRPGYKYHINIDANTQKLPYRKNSVDRIVSSGAWGYNFGSDTTAHETFRILKPGGEAVIGLPYRGMTKDDIRAFKQQLRHAGYRVGRDKHTIYAEGSNRHEITARKPAIHKKLFGGRSPLDEPESIGSFGKDINQKKKKKRSVSNKKLDKKMDNILYCNHTQPKKKKNAKTKKDGWDEVLT